MSTIPERNSLNVNDFKGDKNKIIIHHHAPSPTQCSDCIRKEMLLVEMGKDLKRLQRAMSQLLELTS